MKSDLGSLISRSAYGGTKWSPRTQSHKQEIGTVWNHCGINSEWAKLVSVLIHFPGPELKAVLDPDAVQMLALPNLEFVQKQHNILSDTLRSEDVTVHLVDPDSQPSPNLMFCADLFFMTPEGAILARPASTVRAGEERWIARRLADLGIPILRSLRGNATFEGADAAWLNSKTVIISTGLRTNHQGVTQVSHILDEMGVEVIQIDLPYGTMHLMGILRFLDRDLAIAWPYRIPHTAVRALRERGYDVFLIPDEEEAINTSALNFVTLGPRRILMASGNPITVDYLEKAGVDCIQISVDELTKAAGGIGCLTGVIERETY